MASSSTTVSPLSKSAPSTATDSLLADSSTSKTKVAVSKLQLGDVTQKSGSGQVSPKMQEILKQLSARGMPVDLVSTPRSYDDSTPRSQSVSYSSSEEDDSSSDDDSSSLGGTRLDLTKVSSSSSFQTYDKSSSARSVSFREDSDRSSEIRSGTILRRRESDPSDLDYRAHSRVSQTSSSSKGRRSRKKQGYSPKSIFQKVHMRQAGSESDRIIRDKEPSPRTKAVREREINDRYQRVLTGNSCGDVRELYDNLHKLRATLSGDWEQKILDHLVASSGCAGVYLNYFQRSEIRAEIVETMVGSLALRTTDVVELATDLNMIRSRIVPGYLKPAFDCAVAKTARADLILGWPHACPDLHGSFFEVAVRSLCQKYANKPRVSADQLFSIRQEMGAYLIETLQEKHQTLLSQGDAADEKDLTRAAEALAGARARFEKVKKKLDTQVLTCGHWFVLARYHQRLKTAHIDLDNSNEELAAQLMLEAHAIRQEKALAKSFIVAYIEGCSDAAVNTLFRTDTELCTLIIRDYAMKFWGGFSQRSVERLAHWFRSDDSHCNKYWINTNHMKLKGISAGDVGGLAKANGVNFQKKVERNFPKFAQRTLATAPKDLCNFLKFIADRIHDRFPSIDANALAMNFFVLRMLGASWKEHMGTADYSSSRNSVLNTITDLFTHLSTEQLHTIQTDTGGAEPNPYNEYKMVVNALCLELKSPFRQLAHDLIQG